MCRAAAGLSLRPSLSSWDYEMNVLSSGSAAEKDAGSGRSSARSSSYPQPRGAAGPALTLGLGGLLQVLGSAFLLP